MGMRDGAILNVGDGALAHQPALGNCAPIVMVSGTAMDSGKTAACVEIVQKLTSVGYAVAGAKLTGVACLRDTLNMEDGRGHNASVGTFGGPPNPD